MLSQPALHHFLDRSAQARPNHVAVVEPDGAAIGYGELAALTDRLRDRLHHLGVRPGDRVGMVLHKSIDSVATIFGILKAGAAYIPVDPSAPASRNAYILTDCSVRVIVLESAFVDRLREEIGDSANTPGFFPLAEVGGGTGLVAALDHADSEDPAPSVPTDDTSPDDLAYILYTSGSTGKPKGVQLTHQAAISFVDWCSEAFAPRETDRFSSHAPFHFDLSILDLYVPIKHGATLVLIDEDSGKDPQTLAELISKQRITSWYSTPSILTFLTQYGKLERHDYSHLRTVLFAGEVFPVKHLRALKDLIPHPRYFNLYGPTETNVCTYYEIPAEIPADRAQPYPIGVACSHLETKVVDEQGMEVQPGSEGELVVSGPGVMRGYWNLPDRTANAFLVEESGKRWYKTGDVVIEEEDGDYTFLGRRDRMVKKRGYRIELGEIEAGLYRHPAVEEAAVVALTDEDATVRIKAFLTVRDGERPSIIELKRFCADHLPGYMAPDLFSFQSVLPKTSTDKIDYQKLKVLQ